MNYNENFYLHCFAPAHPHLKASGGLRERLCGTQPFAHSSLLTIANNRVTIKGTE